MSMKIWGKRMLALACAGAMLVPLAACGSDADAGKIRLSYLSWDNEQTSKPYIDEFEKENPDIKTGKYYLHTNFYSKPDILKSELKAQNQQLVQGQITPDQYAKNIDAKVAAAQ